MVVTPILTAGQGIEGLLRIYAGAAALSAAVFAALSRERPPRPPGPAEAEERTRMFEGLKSMLRQKDFLLLLVIFFVGLGMFNGVSTWIEVIVRSRGFSASRPASGRPHAHRGHPRRAWRSPWSRTACGGASPS